MNKKRFKRLKGFTVIEIMVAIAILAVVVLGASGYRYYAALDARRADMRTSAARIGMLLCESWRGVKGSETYDPVAHVGSELEITTFTLPSEFEYADFTPLGAYKVVGNGLDYYAILSWKDVSTGLRALNVVVAWAQRDQGRSDIDTAQPDKLFRLTTYTSN